MSPKAPRMLIYTLCGATVSALLTSKMHAGVPLLMSLISISYLGHIGWLAVQRNRARE